MRGPAPELDAVPTGARRGVRALGFVLAAAVLVHAAGAVGGFGGNVIGTWVYVGVLVGAAAICAARAALVPARRAAWGLLALALSSWAAGDAYWSLVVEGTPGEEAVTLADTGWLVFYPACYAALALLVAARVARLPRSAWLDGLIAATACGALGAALLLPRLIDAAAGAETWTLALNLAYPVGDMMLLAVVVGVFTATGWRLDRMWLLLGGGLAASAVADGVYLDLLARGAYSTGGLLDTLWLAAAVLMAAAAWQAAPRTGEARRSIGTLAVTAGAGLSAIGITTYDHFARIDHAPLFLATATLLLAMARMLLAFGENQAMLRTSRAEALTDALTGLGNRRRLLQDLEHALETGRRPLLLVAFDLDGFKAYNDGFGHPAGDALLARLGRKLAESVRGHGRAYRMGGDEFCVVLDDRAAGAEAAAGAAREALSESGRGFAVAASYGVVRLPAEAGSTSVALQIADQRLYRQKSARALSTRTQTRDVLMRVLHEREPELHDHLRSVGRLAAVVAERLGMAPEAVDEVARAGELHDVGKLAIPDTILEKPASLDESEWNFVRRHTVIGEAILAAAPALMPVARLVRSSHERFDGAGYPDGLAGDSIPLGSRIIFACDAYDAMVGARPYAAALEPEEALDRIREGRGTQFDPAVVAALCDAVRAGDADVPAPAADRGEPAGGELDAWNPLLPAEIRRA